MTDTGAWFAGIDRTETETLVAAITEGEASEPRDWPARAVETGFVDDEAAYYDLLSETAREATRRSVEQREQSPDKQLIHAVRAIEDCTQSANELAERLAEWGGTVDPEAGTGIEYARTILNRESPPPEPQLRSLATRVVDLADEAEALHTHVEQRAPAVAPNLSALAGPILAARLIALAGGLESIAKKPSGTVQVLGAEDALFAHLRGQAPSPKHGVIYTHETIRQTRPEDRGSAARALAGKLAIAARIDHYSGTYRPELEAELDDRIATIRARDPTHERNAEQADHEKTEMDEDDEAEMDGDKTSDNGHEEDPDE